MKRSRIAVFTAIAALTCVSLTAVAIGHTDRISSKVTIQAKKNGQDPDSFTGKVISERPRCERDRKVNVRRRVTGGRIHVGTDLTDDAGNYEVTLAGDAPAGTYVAVATRKVLKNGPNHFHVCRRTVSHKRVVH